MGIALMACSLMVACGNKDEDNNDTTPQEEQIADGINVTFGDATWTASVVNCKYYESYGAIMMNAFKVESSYPYIDMALYATEAGTYTDNYDLTLDLPGLFNDEATHAYCYYYEATGLTTDQTDSYGDWWATTVTTTIKAIDLTALKMTAVSTGTMFSAKEAYLDGVGEPAASRRDFKFTFGNVAL